MKRTKSQKRRIAVMKKAKRKERYFGIVKIPNGTKFCWLSAESKNGWSLGFALDKRTVWLKGLRFTSPVHVSKAIKSKVVFIKLKNSNVK